MLSRFEVRKDMVQELTESAATRLGRIATILTGAVREVTHEVGDWFSDAFEMQEAARRAHAERDAAEQERLADESGGPGDPVEAAAGSTTSDDAALRTADGQNRGTTHPTGDAAVPVAPAAAGVGPDVDGTGPAASA